MLLMRSTLRCRSSTSCGLRGSSGSESTYRSGINTFWGLDNCTQMVHNINHLIPSLNNSLSWSFSLIICLRGSSLTVPLCWGPHHSLTALGRPRGWRRWRRRSGNLAIHLSATWVSLCAREAFPPLGRSWPTQPLLLALLSRATASQSPALSSTGQRTQEEKKRLWN